MTATPKPTYGSQPVPLGKYASVSEAARKMGVTRQEAKRILRGSKAPPPAWRSIGDLAAALVRKAAENE